MARELNIEERISNVVDEMERAIDRVKEIGEFEDVITSDSELVSDMETDLERIKEVNDIVGLALIIASCVGASYSEKLFAKNIEYDSLVMRTNYINWATEILDECQKNDWEDYYDTAWRKVEKEMKQILKESEDE